MSNRQIETASVTFEPVAEHKPSPPADGCSCLASSFRLL